MSNKSCSFCFSRSAASQPWHAGLDLAEKSMTFHSTKLCGKRLTILAL